MKVATGSKTTVKNPRTVCPVCKAVYMQRMYVLIQDPGFKKWKAIGKYCDACGHTIIDKRKNSKDS